MFTLTLSTSVRSALGAISAVWLATCWPAARAADISDTSAEIVLQSLALLGVPYRWGGNDPSHGLDCSGLVQHVFKTVVALDLPRRSEQMSRLGRGVRRADLRAGDLLFFNTLGYANSHVAVYVGDGRFVHAPGRNSKVRVDALDDHYWRHRFNRARRLEFTAAERPQAVAQQQVAPLRLSVSDYPNGP